jgi:hypothetical protein
MLRVVPWARSQIANIALAALAASFLFLPTSGSAQQPGIDTPRKFGWRGLSVAAELGMYMPVGSMVLDSTVRLRGVGAILLDARITAPLHDRFALQASLGWTPTLVAQSDWKQTVDLGGGVWLASLRSALRVTPKRVREVEAFFTPGLGLVNRYGAAWSGLEGATDLALVLGSNVRFHEPDSRWAFTANIEDFITRTGFVDPSGQWYGGRLLNEFVLAFGATFDLARR